MLAVVVLHVQQGGRGGLGGVVGGDTGHAAVVVQFLRGYGADQCVGAVFEAAPGGQVQRCVALAVSDV